MRLDHADGLVLRARIRLDRALDEAPAARRVATERAGDDLDGALILARDCGYAWAERDALALLAEVHEALGSGDKAAAFRREAEALSRRLADTTPPPPGTLDLPRPNRRNANGGGRRVVARHSPGRAGGGDGSFGALSRHRPGSSIAFPWIDSYHAALPIL
jgi:hypothetical protein